MCQGQPCWRIPSKAVPQCVRKQYTVENLVNLVDKALDSIRELHFLREHPG